MPQILRIDTLIVAKSTNYAAQLPSNQPYRYIA